MTRRKWLITLLSSFAIDVQFGLSPGNASSNSGQALSNIQPRSHIAMPPDVKRFGFELEQATGHDIIQEWQELRNSSQGFPIIVGNDDNLSRVIDWLEQASSTPGEIIARALANPQTYEVESYRKKEESETTAVAETPEAKALLEKMKSLGLNIKDSDYEPELGEWPTRASRKAPPATAVDIQSGKILDRVHILMVPAKSSWEIPAYLNFGGWNTNPPPEVHLLLLKKWHEAYGAELVGASFDLLDVRVARRPTTREDAIMLARKVYKYCPDIVDQDTGKLAPLAASLMDTDLWTFWWD